MDDEMEWVKMRCYRIVNFQGIWKNDLLYQLGHGSGA
jgi:hypothetical protein